MMESEDTIRLGISSCLVGQKVRFDGNHKQDSYILGTLAPVFEFVPVCPEVAIGLGVPREPIRLEGDPGAPEAIGVKTKTLNVTHRLRAYGQEIAQALNDISGFILKSKSPSCGMSRVKVYDGGTVRRGSGLFAAELMAHQPLLPLEEEGRLGDPGLRDNFLERVFAYHRWRQMRLRLTRGRLAAFHAEHKLSLMAHSPEVLNRLGQWVGRSDTPVADQADRYIREFMACLGRPATRPRHANVLQHLAGYLKRRLDREDRTELAQAIDTFRRGAAPRIVPVTLLRHHFRRHSDPYIERQVYLYPDPRELLLRNGL